MGFQLHVNFGRRLRSGGRTHATDLRGRLSPARLHFLYYHRYSRVSRARRRRCMVRPGRYPSAEHEHDAFALALGLKLGSPIVKHQRSHSRLPLATFLQSSLQPTPIGSPAASPEKKAFARPLSAPTLASAAKLAAASGTSSTSSLAGPGTSRGGYAAAHTSWLVSAAGDRRPSVTTKRVIELHRSWRSSSYAGTHKMRGFLHVLRCHYPAASKAKLESMIEEARPAIEANDRKAWVQQTRASQSERLRAAFAPSHAHLGALSVRLGGSAAAGRAEGWSEGAGAMNTPVHVEDFLAACEEGLTAASRPPLAELPRGSGSRAAAAMAVMAANAANTADEASSSSSTSPQCASTLQALRTAIGSKVGKRKAIDADELIGLCAHLPAIVDAFDSIVTCGMRQAQRRERERLEAVYRHPVSPAKSGERGGCIVKSPCSGMRFRPTLYDLRPVDEVMEELMPKHATSSSW